MLIINNSENLNIYDITFDKVLKNDSHNTNISKNILSACISKERKMKFIFSF